jgi:hypothetical protein
MQSESSIERSVCAYAKKKGILPMKFTSPQRAGVPDRLFLAPVGRVFFIEFKTEKGKLSPLQINEQRVFKRYGHTIHVVSSVAQGKKLIDELLSI